MHLVTIMSLLWVWGCYGCKIVGVVGLQESKVVWIVSLPGSFQGVLIIVMSRSFFAHLGSIAFILERKICTWKLLLIINAFSVPVT